MASADEALQALAESEPDILLSDIGMPQTDGYTLMRQIRASQAKQGKQIPAIALTAYAGEFNQQLSYRIRVSKASVKSVDADELVKAIVTLIGRNG